MLLHKLLAVRVAVWICLTPVFLLAEEKPSSPTVGTSTGVVRGSVLEGTVYEYLGIPYAAPPVGERRWRAPQPVEAWPGVRDCRTARLACPQLSEDPDRAPEETDEDCLYLDIWTAAPGKKEAKRFRRPVLVWMRGEEEATGEESYAWLDGAALARKGIVVVSVTRRVGPLGYFAHPLLTAESRDAPHGNFGLLDQIAALEWVKENVRKFGGDPDGVTLAGARHGASDLACLLVSPLSRELFNRAILHSSSPFLPIRHLKREVSQGAAMEEVGLRVARRLDCDGEAGALEKLRSADVDEVLEACLAETLSGEVRTFRPFVDGKVLSNPPLTMWQAGDQMDVPLLLGADCTDGRAQMERQGIRRPIGYRVWLRKTYGADAGRLMRLFPARSIPALQTALTDLFTVRDSILPARLMVKSSEKNKETSSYLYYLTDSPSGEDEEKGRTLPSMAGAFALGREQEGDKPSEEIREVRAAMREHWLQFMRTGNPNARELYDFPAYRLGSQQHLEFGLPYTVGQGLAAEACDFFEKMLLAAPRIQTAPVPASEDEEDASGDSKGKEEEKKFPDKATADKEASGD